MPTVLFIAPRFGSLDRGMEVFTGVIGTWLVRQGFTVKILSGPGRTLPGIQSVHAPIITRERFYRWIRPDVLCRLLARAGLGPSELEAFSLLCSASSTLDACGDADFVVSQAGWRSAHWARKNFPKAKIVCVGHGGVVWKELAFADAFVALLERDREKVRNRLPELQTTVINNGIDLERFTPAVGRTKGRHILSVGALVNGKGHWRLLDAFLHLPPDVHLTCVGSGPEHAALLRHPAAASGRVAFRAVPHEDMPSIYQSADVYTLASLEESFALVYFEALACGLPVVVHDGPRQRDIIGPDGIYVDVTNPEKYATALLAALERPLNPASRARIAQYSWDSVAAHYATFLNSLQ